MPEDAEAQRCRPSPTSGRSRRLPGTARAGTPPGWPLHSAARHTRPSAAEPRWSSADPQESEGPPGTQKDIASNPSAGDGPSHSNVLTYKRQHGEEVVDVLGSGGIFNVSIQLSLNGDRNMRDTRQTPPPPPPHPLCCEKMTLKDTNQQIEAIFDFLETGYKFCRCGHVS